MQAQGKTYFHYINNQMQFMWIRKRCVCVGGVLWNAEVDDYYDLFSFLY